VRMPPPSGSSEHHALPPAGWRGVRERDLSAIRSAQLVRSRVPESGPDERQLSHSPAAHARRRGSVSMSCAGSAERHRSGAHL
jgi:hypothetical protein